MTKEVRDYRGWVKDAFEKKVNVVFDLAKEIVDLHKTHQTYDETENKSQLSSGSASVKSTTSDSKPDDQSNKENEAANTQLPNPIVKASRNLTVNTQHHSYPNDLTHLTVKNVNNYQQAPHQQFSNVRWEHYNPHQSNTHMGIHQKHQHYQAQQNSYNKNQQPQQHPNMYNINQTLSYLNQQYQNQKQNRKKSAGSVKSFDSMSEHSSNNNKLGNKKHKYNENQKMQHQQQRQDNRNGNSYGSKQNLNNNNMQFNSNKYSNKSNK